MDNYVTGMTIKALREQKNMTQADLAEKIDVSPKTISKWETAKGVPDGEAVSGGQCRVQIPIQR